MTETRHPAGGEPRGRREASPSIRALDAREALIETPNRFEDLIADPLSEDNAAAVGDHASFVAAAFTFGDFQLQPRDRVLLEDDNPVRLGGRALDVLILLVERAGEVVSKEEIFARVWPKTFVEEGNLRVHITALRKALGDGLAGRRFLVNAPGRGYSFVAPVTRARVATAPRTVLSGRPAPVSARTPSLPVVLTHVLGREEHISAVATNLARRRLITVIGPGGIGKTTVALAAADRVVAAYAHGACFVDLAALSDASLVASALASALDLPTLSRDPVPNILEFLRGKRFLVVIDNCEHVVEAAAILVERLLGGAPGVDVLATSREPLGTNAEYVLRLPSLDLPPSSAAQSVPSVLSYPAVQLFVERVVVSMSGFELVDADVTTVVDLCRRLDGVPLAIELAAAGVQLLGLHGLAVRLEAWLSRTGSGRGTPNRRQRTLRATLDWSYELLSEAERTLLRRISVFHDSFSVEAASAVASPAADVSPELLEGLSGLVLKSMVMADASGTEISYRLLEVVRAYAGERLSRSGERGDMMRRLARYCVELLGQSEVEWEVRTTEAWRARYERATNDVRAALSWAFSPQGDSSLGRRLTVVSSSLFIQLSLLDEYLGWLEHVLAAPSEVAIEPEAEMSMRAALGLIAFHSRGPTPTVAASFARALELADSLGASAYQVRALWGLFANAVVRGEYASTLTFAERFGGVLEGSSELKAYATPVILHERMMSFSLHLLGEQESARAYTKQVLDRPMAQLRVARVQGSAAERGAAPPVRGRLVQGFPDHKLATRSTLARIRWLQGFASEALDIVRTTIEDATTLGDEVSLCYALAIGACPVSLWAGALVDTERFVAVLLETSTRHSFRYWRSWGRCYEGVLARRRGQLVSRADGVSPFDVPFRTTQIEVLIALGDGCVAADDLARVAATPGEPLLACWCGAEALRLEGEVARRDGGADGAVDAERLFHLALARARAGRELAWELRAAMSLALTWHGGARHGEGRDLLHEVHGRFTEGFDSADLVRARSLLASMTT